jgi:hypothetical protein
VFELEPLQQEPKLLDFFALFALSSELQAKPERESLALLICRESRRAFIK